MPYNGSGTYSPPSLPGSWNPAVAGSSASPTDWNTLLTDLAAGLTTAWCRDGQSTVTANIPMASHKFTGLSDGSAAQDSATFGQLGQLVSLRDGAVNNGTTVFPFDDSIPQKTEGDEYMTLAITPASATSKLVIDVVCVLASNTDGAPMGVALFQDTTSNALAATAASIPSANGIVCLAFRYVMTSGTTAATTFKVRAGSNTGTTTFNGSGGLRLLGGVMASSITIQERFP